MAVFAGEGPEGDGHRHGGRRACGAFKRNLKVRPP